jgi:K+-sensing histidine kinase KdpD
MASRHRYATAIGAVLGAVAILEIVGSSVNGATAAQILLLVVLLDARFCGTRAALAASVFAGVAFFHYFVTPKGLYFGDPNDFAALAAFIVMAVVGGELASRAEKRAREVERLFGELQAAFERESEAEAARRTERLKAALLDAMTHNLRTPLTAIKMAVTALIGPRLAYGATLTGSERRELLAIIDEESDRLNRFVGGLVTNEHVTSSDPAVEHVSIADVAAAAAARAETLTRDHEVSLNIDPNLPLVAIDRISAIEVLYMLLDNASKYAPPGTTIRIVAGQHDAFHVGLRVIDEGPGIPEDLRGRVFERFFRIPNRESHDRARGGLGVGLSLAKRLIETQAGRIWIEDSPLNRGTAVAVVLPVAAAETTPRPLSL